MAVFTSPTVAFDRVAIWLLLVLFKNDVLGLKRMYVSALDPILMPCLPVLVEAFADLWVGLFTSHFSDLTSCHLGVISSIYKM